MNSQQGVLNASPGDFLFASLWERWNFYARNPDAAWENAVRDADPAEGVRHLIWGGRPPQRKRKKTWMWRHSLPGTVSIYLAKWIYGTGMLPPLCVPGCPRGTAM